MFKHTRLKVATFCHNTLTDTEGDNTGKIN